MKSECPVNSDQIYQIKVGLLEIKPLIWRRFLVPANVTLHRLHLVLQDLMGWQNYHLYRFKIGKKQYSTPDPDNDFYELDFKNSYQAKLGSIIKEKDNIFLYEYDFGDSWEHQLLIEDILNRDSGKRYPVCIAGENASPHEDSGGPRGYMEMLEIIKNPYREEFRSTRTWLGKKFDPYKFDPKLANSRLSKMRL
jgi:hypothetical protein